MQEVNVVGPMWQQVYSQEEKKAPKAQCVARSCRSLSQNRSSLSSNSSSRNYSLNIGNEKTSFYLRTELKEELKIFNAFETRQKPTCVVNEMILKEKQKRELNLINEKSESELGKTKNQLEFELLMQGSSQGAQRISQEENAGGNSVFSESLSFEIVKRLFSAELLKTEMEIGYCAGSKKTDYSVRIGQKKYGVSVTRAFNFLSYKSQSGPEVNTTMSPKVLRMLLNKKLSGIISSTENVYEEDGWEKQFLHCFVPSMEIANSLKSEYRKMKSQFKSNTILLVTVASESRSIFMEVAKDHESATV
ncbi:predicted protein [Naegleria gruberi]|uniref:Predicted protein n=1 Tax=Naegleria gruberi TaxID=5762 RepID=D2VFI8_NAEGR|nr:uncharacterized protein NAEGRDRAFT_67642 [Naegleria gruberi]EFC44473.1 predicted protein [Naegleria gruberi]|eukprot:XP_002677217.1 predicted protein [Naegleria gruberi strain NEG-M]